MRKAVIYARFSPRRDGDTSKSNDTQEADCRALIAREGWEVVSLHADRNAEGDDGTRPGLWDAVEAVPRGGVLVVSELHRLARCPILEDTIVRALRKKKAEVRAVHGHGAPVNETWQEEMVRGILACVARAQKKAGAELTKARMRSMQKGGEYVGGVPYGYELKGGKLVRHAFEWSMVELMRTEAIEGKNATQIAAQLHEWGYFKRNMARWDQRTIGRILAREGLGDPLERV